MQVVDLLRFRGMTNRDDYARPTNFVVVFNDVGFSISDDGVIDLAPPEEVDGDGQSIYETDDGISNARDASRNAIQNLAISAVRNNPTFRKLQGAYSPKLIRTALGDEVFDAILNTEPDLNKDISLKCKAATIPSISFDTEKSGINKKPVTVVKSRNVSDVTLTFYCSPNYIERRIFNSWMNAIHNPYTNEYSFYNTYAKNFEIYLYDRRSRMATVIHLDRAVPINVGEVSLDYDNNNQVSTIDVTFSVANVSQVDARDDSSIANDINYVRALATEARLLTQGGFGDLVGLND